VNIDEVLNSVSATGSLGTIIPHADSLLIVDAVSATGEIGEVEDKPTEALGSVSATGSVATVTVHTLKSLASASATGAIGTTTQNAVVFNFEAVKEQYNKKRTVTIHRIAA